jgi:pyruvate dehydrogenase E2 component (dihydrolipoamide acetyltransferase)
MPKQISMPKLSDTMEEGALIAWRKSVGDSIKRGEILAEIETDKADMEFESYTEGKVRALLVEPGQTVPIGTPIAIIQLPNDSEDDVAAALAAVGVGGAPAPRAQAAAAAPAPSSSVPATPAPAPRQPAPAAPAPAAPAFVAAPPAGTPGGTRITPESLKDDRLRATPRARKLAEERSVDLEEVTGTGPHGSVMVSDVEVYLESLEQQGPSDDGVRATPLALRVGQDLGIDLTHVSGTGPGGRITKADVLAHAKRGQESAKARGTELFRASIQLSQKRRTLIRNMVRSKAEAPHFYLMVDVRTDALKGLRDQLNKEGASRPRLTYTHLMMKACALALEQYPDVNATYREEERDIAIYDSINIGIAVDVNDELVAPTIKGCQGKDVFTLAEEANELIRRARMRKLSPQDYADGTFTISNLGMVGVDRFYAIITPPQSTILAVGSMQERPIVVDGHVAIGTMTTLGLSVDHRVLDGVKAAQFLGAIKQSLESPEVLVKDAHASA